MQVILYQNNKMELQCHNKLKDKLPIFQLNIIFWLKNNKFKIFKIHFN